MDSRSWIAFLERIPAAQHDNLMLITTVGTEISIQGLLQIQGDCLVVRGRLGGTTDTGRVFFVPYDQINYMGIIKPVAEADVQALLGQPVPTAVVVAAPPVAAPAPVAEAAPAPVEPPPEPAAEVPEPAPPPEPAKPVARTPLPDKARLLERLRARSHSSGYKPPP